ncbi:hypothetical protein DLAC_01136 [Tieghemostelium lacteum]|uniref:SAM domain-containing protein n=1 Tax=Tieghemostelium lacteum TaxID=361077 RepID=A0A152A7X4_TIELA|nr:hypothetical protein DLAC_01136 [Tieghemostelium lacteum]|eukprot:KYR02304.1 hypothetical protein DLAC_01136 [Tieghemostelium lacteum]
MGKNQEDGDNYADILKQQDIKGIHLPTINEQQLTDLNQPLKLKVGHAKSLIFAIQQLIGTSQQQGK